VALLRVAIAGGPVSPIAMVTTGIAEIAVDGTNVYWFDGMQTFYKVPKAGGIPTTCLQMAGAQDCPRPS
jgi:hypothetical protein